MRNLSIDSLRAFVTTADLGAVTSAADHLGRSQPAISLQIKNLEEMLGRTLFIRSSKKLILSNHGTNAYPLAKEILTRNDQLLAAFSNMQLAGQISLGIPSEFATTLLPKIVGRFASSYPDVTLEVFSDLSQNLMSEPQRTRYDLILALHEKPSLKRRGLIRSDHLVWVSHRDFQYDKQKALPLVLAQEGCIYRKRAQRVLDNIKRRWRIIHTNPDLSGIKAALEERLGVTVLAKSTVPDALQIINPATFELPELGDIDISLQYNKRDATEATKRLAGFIRSSLH